MNFFFFVKRWARKKNHFFIERQIKKTPARIAGVFSVRKPILVQGVSG